MLSREKGVSLQETVVVGEVVVMIVGCGRGKKVGVVVTCKSRETKKTLVCDWVKCRGKGNGVVELGMKFECCMEGKVVAWVFVEGVPVE